jgi:hypothetical protein
MPRSGGAAAAPVHSGSEPSGGTNMAVINRKSRMISLRLSNDEYELLHNLYRMHGSRSLSEFARDAMKKVIQDSSAKSTSFEARLGELDHRMQELDSVVGRLVNLIEGQKEIALSAGGSAV